MIFSAGQTATVSVTFTPSSTGNATGSITITSDAQNSPITVALQASGVPAGAHLATLSWNASTSPVNGYFIYRGTSSGGPYTTLNPSSLDPTTTYTDPSVQAGQSYYYLVKAVDSNNAQSAPSNEVSATIPSP
jgi:fibronectin type 3 domain-containing protein